MSLLLASAGTSATTFTYEGSGGLSFGGAAEISRTITVTGTGGFTLAGAAPISTTVVPSVSGGATFGGSASTEFVSAVAAPVAASSGGGGWVSRAAGRLAWFADRSKPKPAAKVFTHSPSGGISFGGSSPSSFTPSPRLRREEEEIVLLFALMG